MNMNGKVLLNFILSAFVISIVAVAESGNPANVPNPAGVAQMYPSAEAIPGGAKLKAKFHMLETGSKVSWSVLAPVDEGNGNKRLIEVALVDDRFVHNATDFHVERTFDLDYAKVNAELKQKAPQANLEVGPGTPLFLYARWMNRDWLDMYNDQPVPGRVVGVINTSKWNHQWGGTDRGGMIILPGGNSNTVPGTGFTKGGITTSLDVSNDIDQITAGKFPNAGVYIGNTKIGSRFENELKLHIDVNDIPRVAAFFQKLENDPSLVEATFGKGWHLVANRKYVGQPMIDNYMDNDKAQAAEKGMALRYRTGSGITSLNYKPSDGLYAGNGVFERIEYDFRNFPDATHPPSVWQNPHPFINSEDPMNPLQLIRKNISGATPSDFFKKSVKITDERLKYELTAPSGDQVEISVDHVKARKLDPAGQETGNLAEFGQLEVEVNHLGAKGSNNTAAPATNSYLSVSNTAHDAERDNYLKSLPATAKIAKGKEPIFHGEEDFKADSPIKTTNASNFKLAFDVFDKIREGAFGKDWVPSGQKYAVAAAALGMLPADRFAPSVNRMLQDKLKNEKPTDLEKETCLKSMVKITNM